VTKYQLDINGNPNGKTVYKYDVYQDGATNNSHAIEDMTPFEYNSTGIYLISNTWMNGYQTGEDIYRSKGTGYELITSKKITYSILRPESQSVLKLKQWFRMSGCEQPYDTYEVNLFEAPITTGLMVPVTETRNLLDNSNNVIGTTEELTYSPGVTIYPTQIKTRKSDGRDIIENINYPQTLSAPGNVYEKMVNRNILAPVIQDQELIDGSLVTLTKVNYNDWLGNANLLLPSFIEVQSGNSASEPRIRFNRFDIYGNILQQQKENAEYQAYIWDYNSLYPVAEIKNAAITDAAYTSFEADGSGGWTGINTNNAGTGPSLTGIRFYNLTASGISKSGLSSAKSYIVSYWSKNGAYSVTGSAAVKTGHTIVVGGANWTYYEHKVTGTATVTVSGTGAIDELRLYPANAQMMTYAYEPLKGMTSQCDAASHIKYFEYDGLCRLKLIRDEDGNILKTYEYHYKQ
jgi:hypothetical protein